MKSKFIIVLLGVCIGVKDACASSWPVEVSIAYVEQLELACAKIRPEKKEALELRMELLFSEGSDVVSKARSAKEFDQLKKWAQDEIAQLTERDLIGQCDSFWWIPTWPCIRNTLRIWNLFLKIEQ